MIKISSPSGKYSSLREYIVKRRVDILAPHLTGIICALFLLFLGESDIVFFILGIIVTIVLLVMIFVILPKKLKREYKTSYDFMDDGSIIIYCFGKTEELNKKTLIFLKTIEKKQLVLFMFRERNFNKVQHIYVNEQLSFKELSSFIDTGPLKDLKR